MHFHKAAAGIDHLERLGRGSSPVHRLCPISKIAVTFVFIALTVSVPQNEPRRLFSFFFYPMVIMSLSGTPFKPLFARLAAALPFVLMFGVSNIIFNRAPALTIAGFVITKGMISFWTLLLKTTLSVLAALLLIASTPFSAIARALTYPQALRIVGLQVVMSYRYIAVLLEEAGDAWTAYMLRAPGVKAVKLRDMGSFLGMLLLRSADRASRVYSAMKCRGFNGVYVTAQSLRLKPLDVVFMLSASAALVFMRFFDVSLMIGSLLAL